jgi:predicted RNase H-like HicB family nuclease
MAKAIQFDTVIFREGKTYVAYSPRLEISSCGNTLENARENLKTAVRLFLEEAKKLGTLDEILAEAGYSKNVADEWVLPLPITTEILAVGWV